MENQNQPPVSPAVQTTSPEPQTSKSFPMVMVIPLAVIILLVSGYFFLNQNKTATNESIVPTAVPTEAPIIEKGTMSLQEKSTQSVTVGQTIVLNVTADSDNNSITGYDVVVKYDPTLVAYVSQKSLLTDFQSYAKNDDGTLNLTAIKKLNSTAEAVFQNMPISELTFRALKTGTVNFSIDYVAGSKKESNLITDKNKDVLGKVEGVEVTIK